MSYSSFEDGNSLEKRLGLIEDKRLQRVFHCTRQKRSTYYLTIRDDDDNYKFPSRRKLFGVSKTTLRSSVEKKTCGEKMEKKGLKNFPKKWDKRRKISVELEKLMNDLSDQNSKLPKLFQSALGGDKQSFKRTEFKDTLKRNFRANMRISFLEERIQREKMQFNVETEKINTLKTRLMDLKEEFDNYVDTDHKSTMTIMDSTKAIVKLNQKKMHHLKSTLSDLGSIKSEMNDLHEDYEKCRGCERFLNMISTDSQKKSVDWTSRSSFIGDTGDTGEFNLQNTEELHKVFYEQEFVCYRLIEQVSELEVILENTQEAISRTEFIFDAFMTHLENIRLKLEDGIRLEEKACEDAESYAIQLIGGPLYDVIAGRHFLMISSYLQELYQLCFVSSNYSLSPSEMFSALEGEYRALQFEEDTFPAALYREVLIKYQLKNRKKSELSKRMRKELIELDSKTSRFLKLLEPPKKMVTRKIIHRSHLIEKPAKGRPPSPPISDREKLYLLLFTNRCDIESLTKHNVRVNVDQAFIDKYFPK